MYLYLQICRGAMAGSSRSHATPVAEYRVAHRRRYAHAMPKRPDDPLSPEYAEAARRESELIDTAMRKAGLSNADVAAAAGLSVMTVRNARAGRKNIAAGQPQRPYSAEDATLERIARAVGLSSKDVRKAGRELVARRLESEAAPSAYLDVSEIPTRVLIAELDRRAKTQHWS